MENAQPVDMLMAASITTTLRLAPDNVRGFDMPYPTCWELEV
jgi:hypothetical protein